MKEKLIQEISNAMTDVLSIEQMVQLNGVLLQIVSKYTIMKDGEKMHEDTATNDRLLEIFLSAKQVEGCTTPTIKYYSSTIKQLLKKMPKKVVDYSTEDIRAYLAVFQRKNKSSKVTIDNIRRIFSSFFAWLEEEDYIIIANFRVGVRISARMLRGAPLRWGIGAASNCSMMGTAKAAVLPVPVCASPNKSRPVRASGIACSWISVGVE